MRLPAPRPAAYSGWPTCRRMPSARKDSLPELIEMTGIPALTAFLIAGASPCGSGSETTIPAGCVATAASIIWRIRPMSY